MPFVIFVTHFNVLCHLQQFMSPSKFYTIYNTIWSFSKFNTIYNCISRFLLTSPDMPKKYDCQNLAQHLNLNFLVFQLINYTCIPRVVFPLYINSAICCKKLDETFQIFLPLHSLGHTKLRIQKSPVENFISLASPFKLAVAGPSNQFLYRPIKKCRSPMPDPEGMGRQFPSQGATAVGKLCSVRATSNNWQG